MKSKMSARGGSAFGGKKKIFSNTMFLAITLFFLSLASKVNAVTGWDPDSLSDYNLPEGTVAGIIENILLWLLYILGIVGIIGFVISGLMYLMAAGDETMIGRAKKGMTYSIVGIIVGLAGVVVINAIDAILSVSPTI